MNPVRRNAVVLALGLVFVSGMVQLAVALGTVTLVAVTGIEGILGLGPAIFLLAGAAAVAPAGRLSDRFGRMPVIRAGFALGIAGPVVTSLGCRATSGVLVFVGLALCGAAQSIVLLSRAAAAEMFAPAHRARGMSFVLFGAVSGAIWGPLVFGPAFQGRALTAHELAGPWLLASLFALAGLAISYAIRIDPRELSRVHSAAGEEATAAAAPLRELLARPGIPTAMLGATVSFAVMAGVMNLAGYVSVSHGHAHGDVFTIISAHIVGMYGLVLFVGDIVERIGRRRAIVVGLLVMGISNAALADFTGIAGMSMALFGLGLGWNISYVAATTELVSLAGPSERGRLVGLSDLFSSAAGAALALGGGVLLSASGSTALAFSTAALAALPAAWILLLPSSLGGRLVRRLSA